MRMQITTIPTLNLLADKEVAFVAGLVDVPQGWGDAFDDHVADLLIDVSADGLPASVTPARLRPASSALPPEIVRELSHSDIDRFVTSSFPRTMPTARSNTEVLFRATELASTYGEGTVLAFAGTLCLDDVSSLDGEAVHELVADEKETLHWIGRVGHEVRRHFGDPRVGSRLPRFADVFNLATWGFGHEPMALGATMPIRLIRSCERYQDLFFSPTRSPGEETELAALRGVMETAGMVLLDEEPELARAVARLRDDEDYISPFAPRGRGRQIRLSSSLVEDLLEENLSFPRPS